MKRFIPFLALALLLASCGGTAVEPVVEQALSQTAVPALLPAAPTGYPAPPTAAAPADAYLAPALPTPDPYPQPSAPEDTMAQTPPSGASIPLTSPAIGPLLEAIATDLSAAEGVGVGDVEFLGVESVVWPDTGLGCPAPDMMYIQVLTEGALVRARVAGVEAEYHTEDLTRFVRCEDGRPVSEGIVPQRQ